MMFGFDPMADKRPWLSAYNYCQLNPVMRVDPTGMIDIMIEDFSGGGEGDGNGDPPAKSSAPKNLPGASSGGNQSMVNNNNGNPMVTREAVTNDSRTPPTNNGPTPNQILAGGLTLGASTLSAPPLAAAVIATTVAAAGAKALYDETQRVYVTYQLTGPGGKVYFGRASGFGTPDQVMMQRFAGHHMKIFGYASPRLDKFAVGYPAGYYAIRGREQMLIDAHGGIGSPRLGNTINAIWEFNPYKHLYLGASTFMFGPVIR